LARLLLESRWVVRPGSIEPGERRDRSAGMTNRAAGIWMIAAGVALGSADAFAAPADCLSYRDNPHVAACANQYGQAVPAARPRIVVAQPAPKSVPVASEPELKSVPVVVAVKAAAVPSPAPETPTFTVDRQVLLNTVIVGAVAGSLLVLIALGAWRWGSTLVKDCPWCASKISRSAQTCPRCFRQL